MRRKKPELKQFAGSWCGTDDIAHSLWSGSDSAFAQIENRVALSGRFLIQKYVQECDGVVRYEWHSIIGWNALTGSYNMYLFDSAGFFAEEPFEGKRIGNKLRFSQKGQNGHVHMVHEILSNGKYKLTIEVSPDNKTWFHSMRSIYKRGRNLR
jgi:Protein of unknown function (DUF1579)